jgi:hypothetical protein
MDLRTRFAMVRIGKMIKVHHMRIGVPYIIFAAETVTARLGRTVALHLRYSETTDQTYFLYLPKRYAKAFTPRDIEDIICDRVLWALVNKGSDHITKLYILEVE